MYMKPMCPPPPPPLSLHRSLSLHAQRYKRYIGGF